MSALHRGRWFPVWLVVPGSISLMVLWLLPLAMMVQLVLDLSPEALRGGYRMLMHLWRDDIVQQQVSLQVARLLLAIVLEVSFGLMLARLLPVRGVMAGVWCAVLALALLTPSTVSFMGWQLLLDLNMGLVSTLDGWFGTDMLSSVPAVLTSAEADRCLTLYLLRDLWQWVPLFALLCYARLRSIERVRYQAVRFDGGTGWHAFELLEWPLVRRVLALGVLFRLLAGVMVDVDLFNILVTGEDGALAAMVSDREAMQAMVAVPGQAPLSWLLPTLLSSADHIGPAAVPVLGMYMAVGQAVLVLPLMVAMLVLVGRSPRVIQNQAAWVDETRSGPRFGRLPSGAMSSLGRWLVLVLYFAFTLLPLLWLAGLALSIESPDTGERGIGFRHFVAVMEDPVWRIGLARTMARAVVTALIAVLLALPMAYSWSRRMLAGDRLMATLMLIGMMMPAVVLALPMVQINEVLGWRGMPAAVGVAHLVYAVPVAVWILVSWLSRVSPGLDAMAMADGFSFMQFLYRVLVPAIRPGIWVALLACFLMGWMEFLFARVLGSAVWPAAVVLLSESVAALSPDVAGRQAAEWQVLAAAAWLVLLPVAIILGLLCTQLPALLSMMRMPGHARFADAD
ncbi:MAG: ABC transporter permease subunit [Lautropia sp.]|nr:ABC transporter permease subunit [Lautropia sp.]